MPDLILVIGPVGSGKTTWARQQRHMLGDAYFLIDRETFLDAVRLPRKYTPQARKFADVLFDAAIAHAIERGLSCVVTLTGATVAERRKLLDRFDPLIWSRRIVCVAPVDPGVAVRRAQNDPARPRTSRAVWPGMVARWYADYVPPDVVHTLPSDIT
jgi:shikimate kinase